MQVSHNWATRPDDERYLDVQSLHDAVLARRNSSMVEDSAIDLLQVRADDDNSMHLVNGQGNDAGKLTHFAFGQLCQRVGAPAGYLRSLPAQLAQIPLAYSLEQGDLAKERDGKILSRQNGSRYVSAVTSATYGRIWDSEVTRAVLDHIDLNTWKVPAASYSAKDPKRATTLYGSDRDVFMFLVSENSIESSGESVNRGVIIWNSEVGSATLGITTMTYDRICDNRIIWGAGNIKSLKIRHTSGAPDRFIVQALPAIQSYMASSDLEAAETIRKAKQLTVGSNKMDVVQWLQNKGFTQGLARKAYDYAESDKRNYNPRSVWGLVQGMTDAAHEVNYTNERVAIETKAGSLLDAIAA